MVDRAKRDNEDFMKKCSTIDKMAQAPSLGNKPSTSHSPFFSGSYFNRAGAMSGGITSQGQSGTMDNVLAKLRQEQEAREARAVTQHEIQNGRKFWLEKGFPIDELLKDVNDL